MISLGHTAVGIAVGIASYNYLGTNNPLFGLSLTTGVGVISHYLADLFPHGHLFASSEYRSKVFYAIVFDLGVSVLLSLAIIFWKVGLDLKFWYILFAIVGSQAPDVLRGFVLMGWLPKKGVFDGESAFHQLMHWHGVGKKTLMLTYWDIWQLLLLLFSLYLLINF